MAQFDTSQVRIGRGAGGEFNNASEAQMVRTLRAARDIAREIEAHRDLFNAIAAGMADNDDEAPRPEDLELIEAAERLCNLLSIVLDNMAHQMRPDLRVQLEEGMTELRAKTALVGQRFLVRRLASLSQQAHAIVEGRDYYILGVGHRLKTALLEISIALEAMGGMAILTEPDREMYAAAETAVAKLLAFESSHALLVDFGQELGETVIHTPNADVAGFG